VALGVGVVGLGTSAALFLSERNQTQTSQNIRLTVSAGPSQAGFVARGQF
jgi:hypothetical protein